MKKKISFLLFCVCCFTGMLHAQVTVKGIILDGATDEPVIGATILDANSKAGTVSDLDGSFTLKVPNSNTEIEISYIGYISKKLPAAANMGTILLESDEIVLGDVVVTASVAVRRKTPVALSVISPEQIEYKISTQEFPEILKSTPGIYATKQGGGFGDARVNIRGFESPNSAIMVNGVPVNDMEWGGVYWSNWSGLTDVARSVQVQRGLGASKMSAPSVGGSINILTKTTDAQKGGYVSYGMGNDGYNKLGFTVSSGLTETGWAVTLLGSKSWGDGYILGTEFENYSYFLNISKLINENHQISLTGFGAKQWHNQRYNGDMLMIADWQTKKEKYQFNPTYGFGVDGQRKTANHNYYHKPFINLNHYWTINEKSSLSTVLYLSLGDGGGYAWRGNSQVYNKLYGTNTSTGLMNTEYRTVEGYMDYAKLQRENAESPNGSEAVITTSRNNHTWVGLISTYNNRPIDKLDITGGVDIRYYAGLHDAKIVDLMGGQYYIDPIRASSSMARNNPKASNNEWVNEKLTIGDNVYRDNTGYVFQAGVFGQAEYTLDKLNVFVSGAINNNSYWKVDRFYYDNEKSEVGNFLGFTIKGGANYNLTENHNVFTNIGYFSRAPFMSGGYFTSIHTSNVTNPDAVNEKLFSVELGYGFRTKYFTADVNVYHTEWKDKTQIKYLDNLEGFINLEGVNALHQGIELQMMYKPIRSLEITGMLSLGNWRWTNNATGYAYNRDGLAVDRFGNTVEPLSPEHATATVAMKDVKVGNSAQTTAALGLGYYLWKDLRIGADFTYYDNNYANYSISSNYGTTQYHTPWKIPEVGLLDLNAQYHFTIGGLKSTISGNVNNVLDQEYISDARDMNAIGDNYSDWKNVAVMYGFGRTFSVNLKIRF